MMPQTSALLWLVVLACVNSAATGFVQHSASASLSFVAQSNLQRLHAETEKEDVADKVDTFKKVDFISAVSAKTGMGKKESEAAMKAVLDVVQEQVANGKRVNLAGFGTFTLKQRAARKGRNPQTGEELQIAASKSPGFSPAKAWKDAVNNRTPVARTAASTTSKLTE